MRPSFGLTNIARNIFLVLPLLWAAGARSLDDPSAAPRQFSKGGGDRVYVCAANTLFLLCRLSNMQIPYNRCLELLPISPQGNSMLQMKRALQSAGFSVEALRVSPDELTQISVPAVVLASEPRSADDAAKPGHYFAVRPLSAGTVQVIDFPETPLVLDREDWGRHLTSKGVNDIPILLCGQGCLDLTNMFRRDGRDGAPTVSPESDSRHLKTDDVPERIILRETGPSQGPLVFWNFGDVPEGSTVKRDFVLENMTKATVLISNLSHSCRCTQLTINRAAVPSGETAVVSMSISLAGVFSEFEATGKLFFSPEAGRAPAGIIATGTSHARWTCDPRVIDFGQCEPQSGTIDKKVVLRPTGFGAGTHISSINSDSDYVKGHLVGMNADDGFYVATVSLEPKGFTGPFHARLGVLVAGDSTPAAVCDVKGEVYPEVVFTPTRLLLRNDEGCALRKARTQIWSRRHRKILTTEVKVLELRAGAVTVLQHKTDASRELDLQVTADPSEEGPSRGHIQVDVHFESAAAPVSIRIPVFVDEVRNGLGKGAP